MHNNKITSIREEIKMILNRSHITDDGTKINKNGTPVIGSNWYIISMNWLEKWKLNSVFEAKVDNTDIIEDESADIWKSKNDIVLKRGLTLSLEYEIVSPRVWKYFKLNYGVEKGSEIMRHSIEISNGITQVEVFYKSLKIIFVREKRRLFPDKPKTVFISHKSKTSDFIRKLREIFKEKFLVYTDIRNIRIWHIDSNTSWDDLKQNIERKSKKLSGRLITEMNLDDASIADNDLILVEMKNTLDEWIFKTKQLKKCKLCQSTLSSKSNSAYCSECIASQAGPHQSKNINKNRHGLTGLQNLGNTCFMNSGLQCLSNTYLLTEYFLSNQYMHDINNRNSLGSGGYLVKEYADLIKKIWLSQNNSLSPWSFKKAFGNFATQFAGYNQQDSQEMLSLLIDGLHEDLNKIKKKPYTEEFKIDGLSDHEIAQLYWNSHLTRNRSIIVDLMHGQFRSEVLCPHCNNVSLAFDPFLMLALPIPNREQILVDLYCFKSNNQNLKIKIKIDKKSIGREIKEIAANKFNLNQESLVLVTLEHLKFKSIIDDNDKVDVNYFTLAVYDIHWDKNQKIIVLNHIKPWKEGGRDLGFSKLFVVDHDVNFKKLHHIIFEFYLKTLEPQNFDISDEILIEKFNENFQAISVENGINLYDLKFLNPNKFGNCPFCQTKHCKNCPVPFSEQSISYNTNISIKIDAVWSKNTNYDLSVLDKLQNISDPNGLSRSSDNISIYDCLRCFSTPEKLDEMNSIYCKICKSHVQGIKKMEVFKLPKILIVHLKRFKHNGYYNSKIDKFIDFPIDGLDLRDFTITKRGNFDLYAVSNHYGSTSGGHYTAYAKNPHDKKWYHFDDSSVNPVSNPSDIITSSAYVLFYLQRDVI